YAASKRKIIVGRWRFSQWSASTAACLEPNRPLVQGRMNVRKFVANLPGTLVVAAGIAIADGDAAWQAARAPAIPQINARVVATNIPGASAISQVGTFLTKPAICATKSDGTTIPFPHPIPALFPSFILPGAVLDPSRILVGSRSNFGAPLAVNVGTE